MVDRIGLHPNFLTGHQVLVSPRNKPIRPEIEIEELPFGFNKGQITNGNYLSDVLLV